MADRKILTSKGKDLHKICSTMVAVVEDMGEELKSRLDDLEDAYFHELGGSVVSLTDVKAALDDVVKDVIAAIESSSQAAADESADTDAVAAVTGAAV